MPTGPLSTRFPALPPPCSLLARLAYVEGRTRREVADPLGTGVHRVERRPGRPAVLFAAVLAACTQGEGAARPADDSSGNAAAVTDAAAGAPACPGCIVLDPVVSLGTPTGDGILAGPLHVAIRDASGRYWVQDRDLLKVYAPDGGFVSGVGRPGEGPGEFRAPVPIHADDDGSVHVLDPVNLRITVLDSTFRVVGETRITGAGPVHTAVRMGADRYVAAMWSSNPEGIGFPLHLISDEGEVLHSFGLSEGGGRLDPFTSQRRLTVDAAGRVFAVPRFAYRVESWDPDGTPAAALDGPVLNRHPVRQAPYNRDDHPIPAEIMDLHADGAGRLWALIRQPRPGWESLFEDQTYSNGMVGLRLRSDATIDDVYRSRISVLSLSTGAVVADTVFDRQLTGFTPSGLIVENAEGPGGDPVVRIWRPSGPD